ncbi:MAG: DUF3347 domain-containing protein [Bacteroidetes bacterium]|nr:DUF3347 domain-containing protein [Bacteroidota bacterium]
MKTIRYFLALLVVTTAIHSFASAADLKSSINAVLKSYLDIKNALAADNGKAANDAAKQFTSALKEVPADQMDDRQKGAWEKYAEKLRYDGEHISESDQIAHQREHFGSLSANLLAVLKVFKDNDTVLYQQYCPMAKKSWISESATIKNPYYGKAMPECGVTKETLKAAN